VRLCLRQPADWATYTPGGPIGDGLPNRSPIPEPTDERRAGAASQTNYTFKQDTPAPGHSEIPGIGGPSGKTGELTGHRHRGGQSFPAGTKSGTGKPWEQLEG